MEKQTACKSCGSNNLLNFYRTSNVPVHSVLLMKTYEEAVCYPRGEIELAFCNDCGFIFNTKFKAGVHEYSDKYEETQGFSTTFSQFNQQQAKQLIQKYDLYQKTIIEIGCGKGDFLTFLCEQGNNKGIGFDPAYIRERNVSSKKNQVTFIADFYSEKYTHYHGDFVCCKMTLEHIPEVRQFIEMVRRSIADRFDTIIFFQVPNVRYIFRDLAFWDIYYEHCSYFSTGSIARLFRSCGFDVVDLETVYDDQYLSIEAKPVSKITTAQNPKEFDIEELKTEINSFSIECQKKIKTWREKIDWIRKTQKRAVIWGSGSKGVTLLNTLQIKDEIKYGVDVNPYKQGTYMAGTGQKIVGKEFLKQYKPDIVIIMNPIYRDEINDDLTQIGLSPEIWTI